jgi:hypothetical protein
MMRGVIRAFFVAVMCFIWACSGDSVPGDGIVVEPDSWPVDTGQPSDVADVSEDTSDGEGDVQDTIPEDADAAPGPGELGYPCEGNADCNSGYCVQSYEGKVCSKTCDIACPEGWSCEQYLGGGADLIYVCLPHHAALCYPCKTNEDCKRNGELGGTRCVSFGEEGAFCGGVDLPPPR